jgi:16S rRNA processing protein RimM
LNPAFTSVREFFLIGKVLKSHGVLGQLRLMIEDRLKEYIQPGLFIFFDLDGSKVPFQISEIFDGQHFVIALEDVMSKESSDPLAGKDILIPMHAVQPRHLKSPRNIKDKWEDYTIHDVNSKTSYVILRTEEYPQQLMAVIEIKAKSHLIPLNDQLIISIDRLKKIIEMEIPEGLLDL